MFENSNFSDFFAIFFVALPSLIVILGAVFEGVSSFFNEMRVPSRKAAQVVLHYHYKALKE